jgi:hypothetical protein
MYKMKKIYLIFTTLAVIGLAINAVGQTLPPYIPASGLIGWWPFTGNAK